MVQAEKVQNKAKAKKEKEPPADISKYLRGAGLMEMRYVRMVSSLCAQTYYMHKLTVSPHVINAMHHTVLLSFYLTAPSKYLLASFLLWIL